LGGHWLVMRQVLSLQDAVAEGSMLSALLFSLRKRSNSVMGIVAGEVPKLLCKQQSRQPQPCTAIWSMREGERRYSGLGLDWSGIS
jgi:hypothetical protein